MKPIGHPSQEHYAAGERCIARLAYAIDIGGVRSAESRQIARNVVEAQRRAIDPNKWAFAHGMESA